MRKKTFIKKCEYCFFEFTSWKGNPKRFCSINCGYKNRTLSIDEIFIKNLEEKFNGCLEYKCRYSNGYGRVPIGNNKHKLAHRYAWERKNGKIPEGINCLHICDNPPCCNVLHLFLGTMKDNNNDMMKKGRHNTLIGSSHPHAILDDNKVIEIKLKLAKGFSMISLAKEYGIGEVAIYSIKSGKTWKHVV